MEESKIAYGLVGIYTLDEIYELKKLLKENGLGDKIIFDKISSRRLLLVEKPFPPSGTSNVK